MLTNRLRIVIVIIFLGLAIWAITLKRYELVISTSELGLWLTEALLSVGPELAGIVIGVVTIDYLNEKRQDNQLKEQLILQMGSGHNDVTDTAVRALRARGWLEDGSLTGANLMRANLEGIDLTDSNLDEAILDTANLKGARLWGANLKETDLFGANLEMADLMDANLQRAYLTNANLTNANLTNANLKEAILFGANLEGAYLTNSNLEEARLATAKLERASMGTTNLKGANLWAAKRSYWTDLWDADLMGATMPDDIKLKGPNYPDGPTYEEWLAIQDSQEEEE